MEAVIPDKIVKSVLKSSVYDMIETNKQKNHIGSAMAGKRNTCHTVHFLQVLLLITMITVSRKMSIKNGVLLII